MLRASSRVVVTILSLLPRALGVASAAMLLPSPARAAVDAPSTIAANSNYAARCLLRRLAFQMQNPGLDATKVTDSDATTFLMAHFLRAAGAQNGISGIWSENGTYLVTVTRNGAATQVHGADLTAADLAALDWSSALVRVAGQNAKAVANGMATPVAIPDKHVGGYVTLSDRPNDNSFAMVGGTAGTNLRMIEGLWTISTGLQVLDFASSPASCRNTIPTSSTAPGRTHASPATAEG